MSKMELDSNLIPGIESSPSVSQKKTSNFFPTNSNEYTPRINDGSNFIPDGMNGSFMSSPFSPRNPPPQGLGSNFFNPLRHSPNSQTAGPVSSIDNSIASNLLVSSGNVSSDITAVASAKLNDSLNMLSINNDDKENEIDSKSFRTNSIWNNTSSKINLTPNLNLTQEESDPTMYTPSFLSVDSSFVEDNMKEKEFQNFVSYNSPLTRNIYSTKVNNPSFIPTYFNQASTSIPGTSSTEGLGILESPPATKGYPIIVENEPLQIRDSKTVASQEAYKKEHAKAKAKAKRTKLIFGPSPSPISIFTVPLSSVYTEKEEIHPSKCVVNLPQKFSTIKGFSKTSLDSSHPVNKVFTQYLLAQDNTKQVYQEDYCSTFYKRNHNGYMFVKEPANSIKINSNGIGTKSWVQIKLNLPSKANSLNKSVGSRKIKIDIRQLPNWKPPSNKSSSKAKRTNTRKRESNDFSRRKSDNRKGQFSTTKRFRSREDVN
ncbi:hypothetical protein CLIB1423_14S02938 [[Candida] railenensis]|uniref:Uncharacterized protein n=1 Tax=[Candida] railenensis TaxID=45579 RepID=A0A9P0QT77_9ASCO|nr:hypothetical protein CLIB1423_14S02938 [[Candida] railenensis]